MITWLHERGYTILLALIFCGINARAIATSAPPPLADLPAWERHVVLIDPNGHLLHPADLTQDSDVTFKTILDGIDCYARQQMNGTCKILLFIQGGITDYSTAISSAKDPKRMKAMQDEGYYPIFIGWNADLFSNYGEHYLVERGRRTLAQERILTVPLTAVSDFGSMVAKAPMTLYQQFIITDFQRLKLTNSYYSNDDGPFQPVNFWHAEPQTVNNEYRALRRRWMNQDSSQKEISIRLGSFKSPAIQDFGRIVSYIVTSPLKAATSPTVETIGLESWRRMRARMINMFYPPNETDLRQRAQQWTKDGTLNNFDAAVRPDTWTENSTSRTYTPNTPGALAEFIVALSNAKKSHPMVLVAHSAGTIVACEILARFPKISFEHIVFMAAACSLNDFQRAVIPYLTANPDSRFYDLCLHPQHEIDEWRLGPGYDKPIYPLLELAAERGSLLEWIDNFFSTPETFMDRMLGKWANIVQGSHIIPGEIRNRITVKGFGYDGSWPGLSDAKFSTENYLEEASLRDGGPQAHGEFASWPYWEPWFWRNLTPSEIKTASRR